MDKTLIDNAIMPVVKEYVFSELPNSKISNIDIENNGDIEVWHWDLRENKSDELQQTTLPDPLDKELYAGEHIRYKKGIPATEIAYYKKDDKELNRYKNRMVDIIYRKIEDEYKKFIMPGNVYKRKLVISDILKNLYAGYDDCDPLENEYFIRARLYVKQCTE